MIKVGDRLPGAKLMGMGSKGPESVSTEELFRGKKVALFSVPGAFTPTCSAKHLPGYIDQAVAFKAKGVDEIVCIAVNDAFVMSAWGKSAAAEGKVRLLADGNAEFTRALGLEMDASKFGMGVRGKRLSMLVEDGVVRQLNIEPPGEFGISSAESLLQQLN
jgi:peroxiredoxin